jgi:hypothetical protein
VVIIVVFMRSFLVLLCVELMGAIIVGIHEVLRVGPEGEGVCILSIWNLVSWAEH